MLWWSPWLLFLYAGVVAGAAARWWVPWPLAAAVGGAVLVGLLLLWAAWWRLPRWQTDRLKITDLKNRADVEDNFRKTIGQAIGGAVVLIAASIAYYGTLQTMRVSELSVKASRDLLISQQVSKGFEDLGSAGDDKLMVRLGGIYALEGVMEDPGGQYHQPVLEALCAFVRDRTKDYKGDGPPATDVQAALTVIGRRKTENEIREATPGFTRTFAVTLGTGARVTLRFTTGYVDLTGSRIPRVGFIGANLAHADLAGADLTNAQTFATDLLGANLTGAHLQGADLAFANLTGANLTSANLTGANLVLANLSGAYLTFTTVTQDQLDKACGGTGSNPPLNLPPKLHFKPKPCP